VRICGKHPWQQRPVDGATIDSVASWADYRHDHPETGPWHYIDIPLADSKIDLARECPNGACVVVKTEQPRSVFHHRVRRALSRDGE
jgi:hypothetical protein